MRISIAKRWGSVRSFGHFQNGVLRVSSFTLVSWLMHQNSEKHLVHCKYDENHDDAKVQCSLDFEKRCLRAGLTLLNWPPACPRSHFVVQLFWFKLEILYCTYTLHYSIELTVLFEGFSQRSVGWWVSWLMTATSLMSLPHPQDNPALHDFYLAEYQDF